eukprot:PhM_4_TR9548/c0_g1_i1/m.107090/K12580/CNOT3, NOT3; CCR4-NOT transcription complex subunit 3
MTTSRKVQAEIDRTMKKVHEGIEVFEDLWEKVYSAPNQIQKERHEADLKKEIKKLQRLRDSLKAWQTSPEVKDKRQVNDGRKLIESKMEMFRVCEREVKTKAYSKEGLALPQRADPADAAKAETQAWINQSIQEMNDNINALEIDLETADVTKKKKGGSKGDRITELIQKHKYHILKLEQILRMMDNDEIAPEDVDDVKDSVDEFVESKGNMEEDEGIYDVLDLPEIENALPGTGDTESEEGTPVPPKKEPSKAKTPAVPTPTTAQKTTPIQPAVVKTLAPTNTAPKKVTTPVEAAPKKVATPVTAAAKTAVSPLPSAKTSVVKKDDDKEETVAPTAAAVAAAAAAAAASASPISSRPNEWAKSGQTAAARIAQQQQQASLPPPQTVTAHAPSSQPREASASSPVTAAPTVQPTAAAVAAGAATLGSSPISQQQQSVPSPVVSGTAIAAPSRPTTDATAQQQSSTATTGTSSSQQSSTPSLVGTFAHTPLVYAQPRFDKDTMVKMLDMSYHNLPHPTDCEKAKPYMPPNPYRTMPFYPQNPHPVFNTPDVFGKFDSDTLFFIFYYQQATYQQYLSAVELKKQSWRYHKKYLTWFQRHEKPRQVTEEFEEGNYVYFDYESGWSARSKQDFTFKYAYLEDELHV